MDWSRIYRDELRNVGEMHRAGMTLLAGTDIGAPLLVPGSSLHDELGLLVRAAGMTPLQALRAATIAPARVVSVDDSLGTVDVGRSPMSSCSTPIRSRIFRIRRESTRSS